METKFTEAFTTTTNDGATTNPPSAVPPPYIDAPPDYSEYVRESYIHATYMPPPAQSDLNLNAASGHQASAAIYHEQLQQQPRYPQQQTAAFGFQQQTAVYGIPQQISALAPQPPVVYGLQTHAVQALPNRYSSHITVETQQPGTTVVMSNTAPVTQISETKSIGRRKTLTHVTDLNTGKEYNIVKKESRTGRRSKEIIREVGGPTTIIKQTPFRTIVKQR
ncbi:hypothetical protein Bpfe_011807 [Biomphalaria pfeifferi]|uniref:Uncharacterized protein n=1 Tax=Biomphalaria pfeifferi TaxID=112525 RepID=A0AAD8BQ67_BIOPF|nr:hypothetical protein Bpfe_011807 [Biomphalaria pfeifferi]